MTDVDELEMHHIGNCGAINSPNPMDERCICGLRQIWFRALNDGEPPKYLTEDENGNPIYVEWTEVTDQES